MGSRAGAADRMAAKSIKFTDRLKVLPLTALLTVLLWLYADAHLTATERDLPIHITILAGANPHGNPQVVQMNQPKDGGFVISIQGSRDQVDHIRQQCDGRSIFTPQDTLDLTYVLNHSDMRKLAAGKTFNAQRLLNTLGYFTKRRVVVTAVRPRRIKLKVDQIITVHRPVTFRAIRDIAAVIQPARVRVMIPRSLLESIGGAEQIQVIARPLTSISALPVRSRQTIPAQLSLIYPGSPDSRVSVTPTDVQVTFTVPPQPRETLFIGAVPVWVNGPPWLLNQYRIHIRTDTLHITVAGPRRLIKKLRRNLIQGDLAPPSQRVIAYLDFTPPIQVHHHWQADSLRYSLPTGISLVDGPTAVDCRILRQPIEAVPTTVPSTAPTREPNGKPNSQPGSLPNGTMPNSTGAGASTRGSPTMGTNAVPTGVRR